MRGRIQHHFFVIFILISFNSFSQIDFISNNPTVGSKFSDPANWSPTPTAVDLKNGKHHFTVKDGHQYELDADSIIINNLTVESNASLEVQDGEYAYSLIIHGNIQNDGTLDFYKSYNNAVHLIWAANSSDAAFQGNTPNLGNITFKDPTTDDNDNSYIVNTDLDIHGNVIIEKDAIFDAGNHVITVSGGWTELSNEAQFRSNASGGGKVVFNNPLAQSISSDNASNDIHFGNLTFAGGGVITLSADVFVDGDMKLINNSFVTTSRDIRISKDFSIDVGSKFNQTAGTVTFSGSDPQHITVSGTHIFEDVSFSGAGVKSIDGNLQINDNFRIQSDAAVSSPNDISCNEFRVDNPDPASTQGLTGNISLKAETIQFNDGSVNGTIDLSNANVFIIGDVNLQSGDLLKTGDFTISGSQVDFVLNNGSTLQGKPGASFSIEDNARLHMRGANNFPQGFETAQYSLHPNSWIFYDGNLDQVITADDDNWDYAGLFISENSMKTIDGDITINMELQMRSNVTFNTARFDVFLGGNVNNDNYYPGSITVDTANYGTFSFCGVDNNQVLQSAHGQYNIGSYEFGNLHFTKSGLTRDRIINVHDELSFYGNIFCKNDGGSDSRYLRLDLADHTLFYKGSADNTKSVNAEGFLEVRSSIPDGHEFIDKWYNLKEMDFDNEGTIIEFYSHQKQRIPGRILYRDIEISGAGEKYPDFDLNVTGNMTYVGGNAVFNDNGKRISVGGDWQISQANTVMTGEAIFFGANQLISGSNFHHITFTGSGQKTITGSINVTGNLTIYNGITVIAGNSSVVLGGNWYTHGTGIFQQTNGTAYLNSGTRQEIMMNANSHFGNLVIDKPNPQVVSMLTDVNVLKNLDLKRDRAILDLRANTMHIGRHFYYNTGTEVRSVGGHMHFDGNEQQRIENANYSALPDLDFSGIGEKVIRQRTLTVNGDISINNTTLNATNRIIELTGDWINNGVFKSQSTVKFTGNDQLISSSEFNTLEIAGAGIKSLDGNIVAHGHIIIRPNSRLDVSPFDHQITVENSWHNDGEFDARNGKVVFVGSSGYINNHQPDEFQPGDFPFKDFYDLEINVNPNSTIDLNRDVEVSHNFLISSGHFRTDNYDLYVGGNFINEGNFIQNSTIAQVYLVGQGGLYDFDPGASLYRDIIVEAPAATYRLLSDLDILSRHSSNLYVNEGELVLNGNEVEIPAWGDIIVQANGILNVDEGGVIVMGKDGTITNNGIFKLVGSAEQPASIHSSDPDLGDFFYFTQNSGTLHARHYLIQNIRNGLHINGGSIDATDNFSHGTFANGFGTHYIWLNAVDLPGGAITATNVTFNEGPLKNVQRSGGNGKITFSGYAGALSGTTFEDDGADLIDWTTDASIVKLWDGEGGDGLWSNPTNWTDNTVPLPGDHVLLDETYQNNYTVDLTNPAGADVDNLTINGNLTLRINGVSFNMSSFNLTDGNLLHTGIATDIEVEGDWVVSSKGSFTPGLSTVKFMAPDSSSNLIEVGGNSASFHHISFNPGTSDASYLLSSNIEVNGNLIIEEGVLKVLTTNSIRIKGNWTKSNGAFEPGLGTVNFNGGNQDIEGGNFWNLTFSGGGQKILQAGISVDRQLTITGVGTQLFGGDNIIFVKQNWQNNSGSNGFEPQNSTVVFDGVTQFIKGNTHFNTVYIAGSGDKYVAGDLDISGDLFISFNRYFVVQDGYHITGTSNGNLEMTNGIMAVKGADNFPADFGNYYFTGGVVRYNSQTDQDIYATSYFNLYLDDNGETGACSKTLLGDIKVKNDLTIGDYNGDNLVTFDAQGHVVELSRNLNLHSSSSIQWNGATLIHNGGGWNMDADIDHFHHLILRGTGNKILNSDITISGDVTVEPNATLYLQGNNMTGSGGASIFQILGSAGLSTGNIEAPSWAFPTNFGFYKLDKASNVNINGSGDRLLLTQHADGSPIVYGNLRLVNTGNVDMNGDLDVNGDFTVGNNAALQDNGHDLYLSGEDIDLRNYTASNSSTTYVDGDLTQHIFNNEQSGSDFIQLNNIVFSSPGQKRLTGNEDIWKVQGDVTINSETEVILRRDITISGSFSNSGVFTHESGSMTFSSSTVENLDFGAENYLQNLHFTNGGEYHIINHGMLLASGVLDIDAASTVDFGDHLHELHSYNHFFDGTIVSENASFAFRRKGDQFLPNKTLTFKELFIEGRSNKTLIGTYNIENLTVGNDARFSLSNDGGTTLASLTVKGNWLNYGRIDAYQATIHLHSEDAFNKTIQSNGNAFHNLTIESNVPANYTTNDQLTVTNQLQILNGANLDVHHNTLRLGNNDANFPLGEKHIIASGGKLNVGPGGIISFNGDDQDQQLDVYGTLSMVGNDRGELASVLRQRGNSRISIEIMNGGSLAARYYQFQHVSDSGLIVHENASVDAVNNFSDGIWYGMNTNSSGDYHYLQMNADVSAIQPFEIENVTFSFTGVPRTGVHFNVKRKPTTSGQITFKGHITGTLAGEMFEDDLSDKILWETGTELTWTGNIDSDWHNSGNWSGNKVPGLDDNVLIPLAVSNNPIVFKDSAKCNKMTISDGVLKIEGGSHILIHADLTIGVGSGAGVIAIADPSTNVILKGSFEMGLNGVYRANGSTIICDPDGGIVNITPNEQSTFGNIIYAGDATYRIIGQTLDCDGDVDLQDGVLTAITNNHELYFSGNMKISGGTLTPSSTGYVILDGDDQVIDGFIFQGLKVQGTGVKTFKDSVIVSSHLEIASSLQAENSGTLIVMGKMHILPGATFDDGGRTHTFSGQTWIGEGNYAGNGTVLMHSNGRQDINCGSFHNLILSSDLSKHNSHDKNLLGDVSVTGDVIVKKGIDDIQLNDNRLISSGGTGTFLVENNAEIRVSGPDNFPSGFATYNLSDLSITYYEGSIDQKVKGYIKYGYLFLDNATTKTLTGDIEVQRNIELRNATLDVSKNNYKIAVGDDFYNNQEGSFLARKGEVIFCSDIPGTYQDIYLSNSGIKDFYDVKIKSAGIVRQAFDNTTIGNHLTIDKGVYRIGDVNYHTLIGGDLTIQPEGAFHTRGIIKMIKNSGIATIVSNGNILPQFEIDGNASYILGDDFVTYGNFIQRNGTFNLQGHHAQFGDAGDVASIGGKLVVNAGAELELGSNVSLNVSEKGTIEVIGEAVNKAVVTGDESWPYNFSVNGTIAAKHYLFEYMSQSGILIDASGTIDLNNNFSNGSFSNGYPGGAYLRIENDQDLTGADQIEFISFTNNPGYGAVNISKNISSTGSITVYESSGELAGESFDNDPENLIQWTGSEILTWSGAIDDDWFRAQNWVSNIDVSKVPDGSQDVVIPYVKTTFPVVNNVAQALAKNVQVEVGAFLTLNSSDPKIDLVASGDLINEGAIIMNGIDVNIEVGGNWINKASAASLNPGSGGIILNASTGDFVVNNGNSRFYDLLIKGSGKYKMDRSTIVQNDFIIDNGATFDMNMNSYYLKVAGDFVNNGTYEARQSQLILEADNSNPRNFDPGSSDFYFITIDPSVKSNYTLMDDLRVADKLLLDNVNFRSNDNDVSVGSSDGDLLDIGADAFFDVRSGEHLSLGAGTLLRVSGEFHLLGADENNTSQLLRAGSGPFMIDIVPGGKIKANNFLIDGVNSDGLMIEPGALIVESAPGIGFVNGTFINGETGSTSCYMNVMNDLGPGLKFSNLAFGAGPTFNIKRDNIAYQGTLSIENGMGALGGHTFEKDEEFPVSANSGLIVWNYTVDVLTWTGASNDDWHNTGNWSPNKIPNIESIVYIQDNGAPNMPVISQNDAEASEVNFFEGTSLTLDSNMDLTVDDNLNVNGQAFIIPDASSSTLKVNGTINGLSANVSFGNNSTVELNSDANSNIILSCSVPFKNLKISGNANYVTTGNILVDGALTIDDGALTIGGAMDTLCLKGDLIEGAAGETNFNGGALCLLGAGDQQINFSGSIHQLGNLNVSGSGIKYLHSNLTVNDLRITSALEAVGNIVIQVNGEWNSKTGNFLAGNSTVEFRGSDLQTLDAQSGITFNNVLINSSVPGGKALELNDPVDIQGSLILRNGIIVGGANDWIHFNGDASNVIEASASSYIDGPVLKSGENDFVFPIGKNGVFARLGISAIAGNSSLFRAEYFDESGPNTGSTKGMMEYASMFEYWDLTRVSGDGQPYVSLYWEDMGSSHITNVNDLVVAHYDASANLWETKGRGATTINGISGSITSAAIFDDFSPVTFGSTSGVNPLPITLINFSATPHKDYVDLNWTTSSEQNNSYFIVERSQDGEFFEVITEENSQGDSKDIQVYHTKDNDPLEGQAYYQLTQVDFDGASTTFDMISVYFTGEQGDIGICVYPNPVVDGRSYVQINGLEQNKMVYISVVDASGKLYGQDQLESNELGVASKEYTGLSTWPKGIYMLNVKTDRKTSFKKLVIR